MERMWINQPSYLQDYRMYHGVNVLMAKEEERPGIVKVYFLRGHVISMLINRDALSKGWV